jgi:hypothetical protein
LSATHIVSLILLRIPYDGYISSEAMGTAVSTLTSLEKLWLEFEFFHDRESQHPPQLTRPVLPALTRFIFKGVSEYLDDLVARFDAPQLVSLQITFFDHIVIDTPQLGQFISRIPKLKEIDQVIVNFENGAAKISLSSISSRIFDYGELEVRFACRGLDRQLSSLVRVCSSSLPPFSTLEKLYINEFEYWQNNF